MSVVVSYVPKLDVKNTPWKNCPFNLTHSEEQGSQTWKENEPEVSKCPQGGFKTSHRCPQGGYGVPQSSKGFHDEQQGGYKTRQCHHLCICDTEVILGRRIVLSNLSMPKLSIEDNYI